MLLACLALALTRWHAQRSPQRNGTHVPAELAVEVTGVNGMIIRDKRGNKQWELRARRIVTSKTEPVTIVEGLDQGIFYRDKRPVCVLSAGLLRFNSVTGNMMLTGNVHVLLTGGAAFTVDAVRYVGAERRAVCAGDVTLLMKGYKFQTQAPHLLLDRNELVCLNGVRLVSGKCELRSDRMIVRFVDEVLDLDGHVVMIADVGKIEKKLGIP